MVRFHALVDERDDDVRRRDDMGAGAVVLDQPDRFGGIIGLEPSDKTETGPGKD